MGKYELTVKDGPTKVVRRRRKFDRFIPEVTDAAAAALFERRYGRKPRCVLRRRDGVCVGPVPEEEARR